MDKFSFYKLVICLPGQFIINKAQKSNLKEISIIKYK